MRTDRLPVRPSARPSAGFTLLELVVGLTITGLAISSGYAALASIIDHRSRAEAVLDTSIRAASERRLLRGWLRGARITPEQSEVGFSGLDGEHEDQPDDALIFLTTPPTDQHPGELLIRLFVDRDTLTPERGLVASLTDWPGTARRLLEIDSRVTGLDIRYFSIPLGERGWLPSWISRSILPSGVEVRLSGDSLPPLVALPLLVPVEGVR